MYSFRVGAIIPYPIALFKLSDKWWILRDVNVTSSSSTTSFLTISATIEPSNYHLLTTFFTWNKHLLSVKPDGVMRGLTMEIIKRFYVGIKLLRRRCFKWQKNMLKKTLSRIEQPSEGDWEKRLKTTKKWVLMPRKSCTDDAEEI